MRPTRASPGTAAYGVTGPLSPADRSHTPGRGPTTHLRYVTLPGGATRGFLPTPPLVGTDIRLNEGTALPVTRRTGETGPERRYGPCEAGGEPFRPGAAHRSHTRPRHSSRSVIARAVPGLPSASL